MHHLPLSQARFPCGCSHIRYKKTLRCQTRRFLVRFPPLSEHSLPCWLLSEKQRWKFCPLLNPDFAVRARSRAQGNGCVIFSFSSSESGSQPVWLTSLETHHRVQKGDYMGIIWIFRVPCLICNQTILLEEPQQNFQWVLSMFLICFTVPFKPWGEKGVIWREKNYLYWWIIRFSEPNLLILGLRWAESPWAMSHSRSHSKPMCVWGQVQVSANIQNFHIVSWLENKI